MGEITIHGSLYHIQRGKLILVEGLSVTGSEIINIKPKHQMLLKKGLLSIVKLTPNKPKRLHKRIVANEDNIIGYLVDDDLNVWAKCKRNKIHLVHKQLNKMKNRWINPSGQGD